MTELRRGLPELPDRIKRLPIDERGYPIPWFVAEINGVRDFRLADPLKRQRAAKERRCWICGDVIGRRMVFVVGPMCVVNRNTSEPGCHNDCAIFAVKACPFLVMPKAKYRNAGLPDDSKQPPHTLPGNPGVVALYTCETFEPYTVLTLQNGKQAVARGIPARSNSWLIRMGTPSAVRWYSEGEICSRERVFQALEERLPTLYAIADAQDISTDGRSRSRLALDREVAGIALLLPPGDNFPAWWPGLVAIQPQERPR